MDAFAVALAKDVSAVWVIYLSIRPGRPRITNNLGFLWRFGAPYQAPSEDG
jgi:hypothetical protein